MRLCRKRKLRKHGSGSRAWSLGRSQSREQQESSRAVTFTTPLWRQVSGLHAESSGQPFSRTARTFSAGSAWEKGLRLCRAVLIEFRALAGARWHRPGAAQCARARADTCRRCGARADRHQLDARGRGDLSELAARRPARRAVAPQAVEATREGSAGRDRRTPPTHSRGTSGGARGRNTLRTAPDAQRCVHG